MSKQAVGKFLIGGVNFKNNFGGRGTITTAVYGAVEQIGKVAPLIVLGVGLSKSILLTLRYGP